MNVSQAPEVSVNVSPTPASSTTSADPAPAGSENTLKIGYIGWLGHFVGVDTLKALQIRIDMINEKGGLTIGPDKYNVVLVSYDSNNTQATAVAATNRLIFEDKVQFIVSDGYCADSVITVTEANKTVYLANDFSPFILKPENKYCFNTGGGNSGIIALIGWYANNYPDKKNVLYALPDDQWGQIGQRTIAPLFKNFGFNITFQLYPPSATDLSSFGTKTKNDNPDMLISNGNLEVFHAAWQSGYRGQMVNPSPISTQNLRAQLSDEVLEGFMAESTPAEFDPALTQTAQDFKTAWIAKYGKWEDPELTGLAHFDILTTAIQKTGKVDVEAVTSILSSGLEYDTPVGQGKLISRPDMGNDRTIDSLPVFYVKKVSAGKPILLATINTDDGLAYFRQAYPAK